MEDLQNPKPFSFFAGYISETPNCVNSDVSMAQTLSIELCKRWNAWLLVRNA